MTEIQFSDIWKNQTIQHFELFQDKERFFHSFAWAVAGHSHHLLRKRLTLWQLPPADFDWYENLKDMIKIENMIKDNSCSIHFRVNKDWIPLSANKRIVSASVWSVCINCIFSLIVSVPYCFETQATQTL